MSSSVLIKAGNALINSQLGCWEFLVSVEACVDEMCLGRDEWREAYVQCFTVKDWHGIYSSSYIPHLEARELENVVGPQLCFQEEGGE